MGDGSPRANHGAVPTRLTSGPRRLPQPQQVQPTASTPSDSGFHGATRCVARKARDGEPSTSVDSAVSLAGLAAAGEDNRPLCASHQRATSSRPYPAGCPPTLHRAYAGGLIVAPYARPAEDQLLSTPATRSSQTCGGPPIWREPTWPSEPAPWPGWPAPPWRGWA